MLCYLLMKKIEASLNDLENKLIAKYLLTKYAILYGLRRIFDSDEFGRELLANPEKFVRSPKTRKKLMKVVSMQLDGLIIDLNVETSELTDDFDYRGKMRDKEYVSDLMGKLLASYQKDIKRKKAKTMRESWNVS